MVETSAVEIAKVILFNEVGKRFREARSSEGETCRHGQAGTSADENGVCVIKGDAQLVNVG